MVTRYEKRILDIEKALDENEVLETAWALTEMGMHVLPVRCTADKDKEKIPVYPYSSRNVLTKDDDWETLQEAFSDTRYGIALSPHLGCGLIIIDADTPEEVQALKSWWEDMTGQELPEATVITPGMQDSDGNWAHEQGGHWYIAHPLKMTRGLDETRYSKNVNVEYGESHFNVRLHGSYNILPPSKRSSGSYKLHGYIIDGKTQVLDEDTTVAEKLLELCEKKTPEFKPITVIDTSRFVSNGTFDFPEDMSLGEKLSVWVDTLGAAELIYSTGKFSPDDTSTCGQDCIAVHYDAGTQGRSAVVHGRGCTAAPYGTVTIFSDTLKADVEAKGDVTSVWSVVKALKYGGDTQAAIHGEGLHTEVRYGGEAWMRARFSKKKYA